MKTITIVLTAFLMSACAGTRTDEMPRGSSRDNGRALSGSATAPSASLRGNTMNDHDKMLEMCRSMRVDRPCDEVLRECHGSPNHESCMRQFMR